MLLSIWFKALNFGTRKKSKTIQKKLFKFTLNLHIKAKNMWWLSLINIEEIIIIPLQAGITPLQVPLVVQVLILEPFNSIV